MFKQICAAVISLAAISSASATNVDWYGNGVLTSVASCPNGAFDQSANKVFAARYMPPNLGTNGNISSLSFINPRWAVNFAHAGAFATTLQTVGSTTVARSGGPSGYTVKLQVTRTPATINANTPMITLDGTITGFSGFPTNNNCTVNFSVTVFRP
ncbi:MAG: hypothetical protein WBD48_15300 [Pseudolabrys sp.]|jgi:hypothetical protein